MLIIENDVILGEVKNVKSFKIGNHEVIRMFYKVSYIWYLLIALAVFINLVNLFYFRNNLGIHSYLIIGLLILYFRHLIVDILLEDFFYYDVIDKDEDNMYVEYSKINYYDYVDDKIKPKFDMFTIFKVFLHYLMYVLFAYYLKDCPVLFSSLLLTSSMFISSYLSIDYDYSDFHYYLNFSLCCLIPYILYMCDDKITLFMLIVLFGIIFYCLFHSKNQLLLKIFLVLFCLFSHYHHYTYHNLNVYKIENGAFY